LPGKSKTCLNRAFAGIFVAIAILALSGCKSSLESNNGKRIEPQDLKSANQPSVDITIPDNRLPYGETLELHINAKEADIDVQKITVSYNNNEIAVFDSFSTPLLVTPESNTVGQHRLKVDIQYNDSLSVTRYAGFIYFSDVEPKNLSYSVLRKFPHDTRAYTQGYAYHNGYIYEGTGQPGHSSVRKINPGNGEVIVSNPMEPQYFGEGITILNNRIYQVTWQAQTGFIYDLEVLNLIKKVKYPFREGWGLTNNGKNLIMSDGSAKIYTLEPEMFTELARTEVFDNKGMVPRLNELEYVNGKLFANIYGQKRIALIEYSSGRVLAYLDLEGIFPKGIPNDFDHVLNGIAYNPDSQTFYVTGKYWPVVYELEIDGWK